MGVELGGEERGYAGRRAVDRGGLGIDLLRQREVSLVDREVSGKSSGMGIMIDIP